MLWLIGTGFIAAVLFILFAIVCEAVRDVEIIEWSEQEGDELRRAIHRWEMRHLSATRGRRLSQSRGRESGVQVRGR